MNLPSTGKTKKALTQTSVDITFKRARPSKLFQKFLPIAKNITCYFRQCFTYCTYKLVCEFGVVNLCIIFILIYRLQNILLLLQAAFT